jgi:hypothetical protein
MRALITKGGAASPDNAADGLAEEEKKAVVSSASMVDKDLRKHINGKPQNVRNVTWGANTVQEYHTVFNDTLLLDDVDMRTEDAGDAVEVQKDTNSSTPKQHVPEREVKSKPGESNKKQEIRYVPKVKAKEIKSKERTPQTKVTIQHDKKDIHKN